MVGCLLTKNCTPLSAGVPARPSGPDSGRSTPIFSGLIGGGLEQAAPARTSTAIPASANARAIVDTTRRLSPPANRYEYVRRPGSLYTRSPHLARSIGARPIENGVRRTPQAPL